MNYKTTYTVLVVALAIANTTYAIENDSIGVLEQNGKKMILHQVGKETLYSIAKKYAVSVSDIKSYNPEVEKGLKVGQKILIPLVERAAAPSSENYVFHKVEANQTLYAISKKYKVKVDDIKRWNNIETSDMKVGSLIIVGEKSGESPLTSGNTPKTTSRSDKTTYQKQTIEAESGYMKSLEKGNVDVYETADGNTFYYGLHRTAPVGTIMKVSVSDEGNFIYARITGKMPQDTDGSVVIRLTKISLEKLQAEKNSKVNVEYVIP